MKTLAGIKNAVSISAGHSTWKKAVREDAMHLLHIAIDEYGADHVPSNLSGLENILLNGAEDWKEYSYGGSHLIYDYDIAKHYCTPSMFKARRDGEWNPNKKENWLDIQARALYQACGLIEKAAK